MANPKIVSLKADTWVKVAEGVTDGVIKKLSNSPSMYLETYRMAGGNPPTGTEEGCLLFSDVWIYGSFIGNDNPIDVYVRAVGSDGKIRVDL